MQEEENDKSQINLPEISREAFEKDAFDAIQFIKTQLNVNLSFIPDKQLILSHIVQQLQKHQENCHKQIVDLLQTKKNDLLSFSQKLEKIRRQIAILEELYESIYSQIKQKSNILSEEFKGMKNELIEIKQIKKEQFCINAVLKLHGLLKNARNLFNSIANSAQKEEICEEVAKLIKKIKKNLEIALKNTEDLEKTEAIIAKNIRNEVDILEKKLLDVLLNILSQIPSDLQISSQNSKLFYHILKSYVLLNEQVKIYDWLRQKFISPLSASLIEKIQDQKSDYLLKMKNLQKDSKEPEPLLTSYFNGILKFVQENAIMRILLEITVPKIAISRNNIGNLKFFVDGYNFILNSIWEQVQNDLTFKQSSMFSSAIPRVMQINYALTLDFIQKLSNCGYDALKSHEFVKRFIMRFEFKPYFQVFYMDISRKIEGILGPITNDVVIFSKSISPIIIELFSGQMFIKELGIKFLSLAIQILNRYITHLQKIAAVSIGKMSTENCYKLIGEIMSAADFIKTDFLALVYEKIKCENQEINEKTKKMLEQLISDCVQKLEKLLIPYVEMLKYEVSTTILQNSDSLKSIVAMYRMTGKPFTNQPSAFSSTIFRPLINLMNQTTFQKISKVCLFY